MTRPWRGDFTKVDYTDTRTTESLWIREESPEPDRHISYTHE